MNSSAESAASEYSSSGVIVFLLAFHTLIGAKASSGDVAVVNFDLPGGQIFDDAPVVVGLAPLCAAGEPEVALSRSIWGLCSTKLQWLIVTWIRRTTRFLTKGTTPGVFNTRNLRKRFCTVVRLRRLRGD